MGKYDTAILGFTSFSYRWALSARYNGLLYNSFDILFAYLSKNIKIVLFFAYIIMYRFCII
ncbi:hypothetical protein [Helicobacter sp. MIT 99-5507]|uniref:hypothetical protein n=1 Tax=Helicobacter sp. MIT 99-5507 TaxID=152489 RepID=UPI0015F15A94|nr:hypothetical protein [Helicobacter sp. MIT 99-5507]